jgi:hypothetical protein
VFSLEQQAIAAGLLQLSLNYAQQGGWFSIMRDGDEKV